MPQRSGDCYAGCCDAVPIRPIRASAGPGGDAAIRAEHDGSITSDDAKNTRSKAAVVKDTPAHPWK